MAFRADEASNDGLRTALRKLVPREASGSDRVRAEDIVNDLAIKLGPVIDSYPTWHPIVSRPNTGCPIDYDRTQPDHQLGYRGLDHTVFFVNGFVTCPYGDRWREVIESVEEREGKLQCHVASLSAQRIDDTLYHPNATPVLVLCEWKKVLPLDKTIPKSLAIPLMLSHEIPNWEWAKVGETWETMRHYFLGEPHGKRSSLFVDQETGQAMKTIWNGIIKTGMFGPIRVD